MFALRFPLALMTLATCLLHAHGDSADGSWNGLHITPATQAQFFYPYDGRAPKIAALLHNHDDDADSLPVMISAVRVNGQAIDASADLSGGGPLVLAPLDVALPSLSAAGVYEGRFGPPPAVGETKTYRFEFDFTLAPGTTPSDDDAPPVFTLDQEIRFTNLGDTPTLGGATTFSGVLRVPALVGASSVANPKVEVASPFSPWLNIPVSPVSGSNGTAFSFSQALPSRNDLYLRYSADGYESQVIWLGYFTSPAPSLDITLNPAPDLDFDFRRATAITTSTGFWRGAVSESEGTFVVFPGQATWKQTATDADARALRAAGRIAKYRYDGTKLWEHVPGWETWGGDMTVDGRYVAYVLNPIAQSFYTPTENKLVLLDGANGSVIWSKSAAPTDTAVGSKLEAIELRFSPDAKWIAVGSLSSGQVTLVDRATGNFAWSTPEEGPGFGAVRRLCFSPDSQFLYIGSDDGGLRKLKVADGSVEWRRLVYDAPHLNGLNLSGDGAWITVGSKSGDASATRTSDGMVAWQGTTESKDAVFAPDARHLVTRDGQVYATLTGAPRGFSKGTGVAQFAPDGRSFIQVGRDFKLYDLGGKLLKTFEAPAVGNGSSDDLQWIHLSSDGRYLVVLARDMAAPPQTGIVIYERRPAKTGSIAPVVSIAPLAQSVTAGAVATLNVAATGTPPLAIRWRRNGSEIAGANGASLMLPQFAASDGGAYTVVVSNAAGSVISSVAALAATEQNPIDPPRIINLSARSNVTSEPLIVGFAVGGANTSASKLLLIRGVGPALAGYGVGNPLADPQLSLYRGTTLSAANDNWGGLPEMTAMATRVGAFPFLSSSSKDAAMALTATSGGFSVHLTSGDRTTGDAMAEIYDASGSFGPETPRLINISARTNTGPGNVLTAGFVIAGPAAREVLIRGVGPSLAQYGVTGTLVDPQLTLYAGKTVVATNDNWYEAPNALQIATATTAVGAFALDSTSRDAAILVSLPPGGYTAQVTGAGGSSGETLVEVYEVP